MLGEAFGGAGGWTPQASFDSIYQGAGGRDLGPNVLFVRLAGKEKGGPQAEEGEAAVGGGRRESYLASTPVNLQFLHCLCVCVGGGDYPGVWLHLGAAGGGEGPRAGNGILNGKACR